MNFIPQKIELNFVHPECTGSVFTLVQQVVAEIESIQLCYDSGTEFAYFEIDDLKSWISSGKVTVLE